MPMEQSKDTQMWQSRVEIKDYSGKVKMFNADTVTSGLCLRGSRSIAL